MAETDLSVIDGIVEQLGGSRDAVIPILQAIQEHYRYLPEAALAKVCEITDITPAAITGVSTFYDQFRHRPLGEHVIRVCHGTACHVKGAPLVTEALLDAARKLGIDIPALCFLPGHDPSTSCMVCVVKLAGSGRFVPSCATTAVDGMEVESETDEVRHLRRANLELLLSDHLGDCIGPCHEICPAKMNIPLMLPLRSAC